MKKTIAIIEKGILFSLIPAVFTLLGSSSILDKLQQIGIIGTAVPIQGLKDLCSLLGILFTFTLLTTNLIIHEMEEGNYRRQSQQLIKYNKDILVNTLSDCLGKEYCNIDIRIFVPYKTIWWRICHLLRHDRPLMFSIKNIDGLAEAGMTNNLKFCVEPESKKQGLVGECYHKRKIIYDDNLQETNDTEYNLTDYQKNKTNDLKFIIVCPIFSQNRDIAAIVAFDSKHEIKVNGNNDKFINAILNYTQQMYEYVPELFKGEGGLIW